MDALQKKLLNYQRNEITEHYVYLNLAKRAKGSNAELLRKIADDELKHYHQFRNFTGRDVAPDRIKVFFFSFITAMLGLTFTLKMMENGEVAAEENYETVPDTFPDIRQIIVDEVAHEEVLLKEVDDEHLNYLGSVALALNNSAQEFTGIAVGLTFALQNAKATGGTTLVSGLAATLAMMASEYLSQKTEKHDGGGSGNPVKAALYAGAVYLGMVLMIVAPYFIFEHHLNAMLVTVSAVFVVMVIFSFFMSVVKDLKFTKVLLEGLAITILVVAASYVIGILASKYLGLGH